LEIRSTSFLYIYVLDKAMRCEFQLANVRRGWEPSDDIFLSDLPFQVLTELVPLREVEPNNSEIGLLYGRSAE